MGEKERRGFESHEPDAAPVPCSRKPYVAPKIIEYGSASKLSAGKPGPNSDGATMKTCL
jgi:hypothetical protein